MFLSDPLETIFGVLVVIVFGLRFLAGRMPRVRWLQAFRPEVGMDPIFQRRLRRARRSQDISSSILFILIGVAVIPAHIVLSVMFFHDPFEPGRLILPVLVAVAFLAVGGFALRSAWRRRVE